MHGVGHLGGEVEEVPGAVLLEAEHGLAVVDGVHEGGALANDAADGVVLRDMNTASALHPALPSHWNSHRCLSQLGAHACAFNYKGAQGSMTGLCYQSLLTSFQPGNYGCWHRQCARGKCGYEEQQTWIVEEPVW